MDLKPGSLIPQDMAYNAYCYLQNFKIEVIL